MRETWCEIQLWVCPVNTSGCAGDPDAGQGQSANDNRYMVLSSGQRSGPRFWLQDD